MLYTWYRKNGRHTLPWRKITDPYNIFISELMLQQTQVDRVIPKYNAFLKKFPNARMLARAQTSTVLKYWQGLGYNRRALFAQRTAIVVVKNHKGIFPREIETLEKLPGIGPYTARAISVFAYNESHIFVETNIRTVIIHHFFPKKKKVSDEEIKKVLVKIADIKNPRKFYSAMMDYGSVLKREGVKTHRKSKSYQKQSSFQGSFRQIRGALLRAYVGGGISAVKYLIKQKDAQKADYIKAFELLRQEGFIGKK